MKNILSIGLLLTAIALPIVNTNLPAIGDEKTVDVRNTPAAKTARPHIQSAMEKADLGDYPNAIADISKGIELNPKDPTPYILRGMWKKKSSTSSPQEALRDYNKAIELNPQDPQYYAVRGFLKVENFTDKDGPIADFKRSGYMFRKLGNNPEQLANILKQLRALGITDNLDRDPKQQALAYVRSGALAYVQSGNNEESIAFEDFNTAIVLDPDLATTYSGLASRDFETLDLSTKLAYVSKAIALNPKYAELYYLRASLRSSNEEDKNYDPKAVLADYNKAIPLNPNAHYLYFNRGYLKSKLNDKAGAIKDLRRGIQLLKRTPSDDDRYDGAAIAAAQGHIQSLLSSRKTKK